MPVCARCFGLRLGALLLPVFIFGLINLHPIYGALLMLPMGIDGGTQTFFVRESNNWLRLVTGILAAVGLMAVSFWAAEWMVSILSYHH